MLHFRGIFFFKSWSKPWHWLDEPLGGWDRGLKDTFFSNSNSNLSRWPHFGGRLPSLHTQANACVGFTPMPAPWCPEWAVPCPPFGMANSVGIYWFPHLPFSARSWECRSRWTNKKQLLNGEMARRSAFLVQEVFDSSKLPKASMRNTPASSLGAPASSHLVQLFSLPCSRVSEPPWRTAHPHRLRETNRRHRHTLTI